MKERAKRDLASLVKELGGGFHPDTPAHEYCRPSLTYDECVRIDGTLTQIHRLVDEREIYEIMSKDSEFKGMLDDI